MQNCKQLRQCLVLTSATEENCAITVPCVRSAAAGHAWKKNVAVGVDPWDASRIFQPLLSQQLASRPCYREPAAEGHLTIIHNTTFSWPVICITTNGCSATITTMEGEWRIGTFSPGKSPEALAFSSGGAEGIGYDIFLTHLLNRSVGAASYT